MTPPLPFFAEGNLCGDAAVRLVCRGHVIVADILRLSEQTPLAFDAASAAADTSKNPSTASGGSSFLKGFFGGKQQSEGKLAEVNGKYNRLLFDFAYLQNPEDYESQIGAETSSDTDMRALEVEFASSHREEMSRFYHLFESIYLYYRDLNKFATDLSDGYYILYSVESVLLDVEGRKLLCEVVYLYGMMLILMERHIQGPVRERIVSCKNVSIQICIAFEC